MDSKSAAISSSVMNFLTIISLLPTLVESKSRSLVARTHKGSKKFLTTTIRERFYVALAFTFVTFVFGLSISLRSRYKDQYATRFVKNTLPALGTIYETMAWDTFENLENHLVSGLQLKQSETGEEVPLDGHHFTGRGGPLGSGPLHHFVYSRCLQSDQVRPQKVNRWPSKPIYLKRLDLYDDAVVFQMRKPWDKLNNQRYIGFYPLDFCKLQSRKLLFPNPQDNSSSPVNMLQITSRRWFRQIGEKESKNFLQRDLSSIQRMLYKIFLYFDEVPTKLGTWSSPSIATFSLARDGQRTLSFRYFYKEYKADNHGIPSTTERTSHLKIGETTSPLRKVTFVSIVLDATATKSTTSIVLKAFKGCPIDNNQGEVRLVSQGGLIATSLLPEGGQQTSSFLNFYKNRKDFYEKCKGGSLDTPPLAGGGQRTPFPFLSKTDERGGGKQILGFRKSRQQRGMVKNEKEFIFQQEAMEIDLSWDDDMTNSEGLELEDADTLEFIAQSLPVYTNKATSLSPKEFVAALFEAIGKKDIHYLEEKSIKKRKAFFLTRSRLMSGYTYSDFMRSDIEKKFVQLLVKNRVNWRQIPSASILGTKEVTLPSSIRHFLTREDKLEGTDTMVLPPAKIRYQDIAYTGLNELRNILSSLKINITDDELEQVDIWELAYWGPAAVQNKATKDITPRNKGKINRRVAVLLQKSDERIPLIDHKANFLSKKEFHYGEGLSRENLRLALQARPQNKLSPKENSSFATEAYNIEDKSNNAAIKGSIPGFKDVFAGLEPKLTVLDPMISTGDEEEPPLHPTEIIVTKSPSLFNEKDEMMALSSKEWANILKSVISQALSGKGDLDKIEILLPTIMVADPLERSSSQLSLLRKVKDDPFLKLIGAPPENYKVFTNTEYQELVSATGYFFGETAHLTLPYDGKRSPFTENREVPLLVCHFLPPSQTKLMGISTKQKLTSTLYKKQKTSFTSRYPFTNAKGLTTPEAAYLRKKRPLFHESWEPISPSSWMIVYKCCFAMWVQEMGKDFYKQYGKEILLYALHLLAALGFNAQDIIEDLGLEESSIRIIRKVDKKFADIAGINLILPELGEIVWLLRSSGRGGQAPKGILLVGPPGTGKTFVVQALAGEAKVPVIVQSASALTDPNKKQSGSQKLRDLFDQARQLSPCILFIDEIDTLGVARPHVIGNTMGKDELLESIEKGMNKSGEVPPELHYYQQFLASPKNMREDPEDQEGPQVISWEAKDASVLDPSVIEIIEAHNQQQQSKLERLALLMQFLMEIDGLRSLQGVVVIGATNRPSVLDPAFIRPGRFEKTLSLQLPDREKRIEILKLYAKKLGLKRSFDNHFAGKVNNFINDGHSSREERPLTLRGRQPQADLTSQHYLSTPSPWEYIANRTAGLSAAHLAAAVNQSSIKGIIDETGHTIETIEHGINRVIKRSSRQSAHVSSCTHLPLIHLDMETGIELFYLTSFYTWSLLGVLGGAIKTPKGLMAKGGQQAPFPFFTKTDEGGNSKGQGPSQDPKDSTLQKEKLHNCASQIVESLEDKTVSRYIISNSLKASGKSIQRFAFYQSGKAILQMALSLHPSVSFLPLEPQIFHTSTSDLAELLSPHGPFEPQPRKILETRLIGVYAGKAGELLGVSQCRASSQQSETTGIHLGAPPEPPINEPISKSKQQCVIGISGLSSQSDLGVEELTFAGLIVNHMISSWYLYSKKISLQKLNLAFISQEESEVEVDDPVLLDLFRYLEKTIEDETRFAGRTSFTYQQRFAPSWWQLQTMAEESLVEPNNSDWYRLHIPDPKETERNIDWISPDNHYHSVKAKLFKNLGMTTLTWNDLYLINRDDIYQALISSCFHKAITLLDKKRELLDLSADQLIRYNLLREYEIGVLWKRFSSAVTGNTQEQADKSKGNLITHLGLGKDAKSITKEIGKTKKEERGLGDMVLHKDKRHEVQDRWGSLGQRGKPYSRRGKYRFVDFDFIKPCFFTKKNQ